MFGIKFLEPPVKRATYNKVIFVYTLILISYFVIFIWANSLFPTIVFYGLFAIYGVFGAFAVYSSLYIVIQRLKTLGYSPWWAMTFLFPIIFIFLGIALMFQGDEKIKFSPIASKSPVV